ncbi:MAG: hypothetical protein R3293_06270, partial [Candidatus Promineifilaceae bacterium]|nr:hypothetical protein [Candidatus Promineifilaceae bacterium]
WKAYGTTAQAGKLTVQLRKLESLRYNCASWKAYGTTAQAAKLTVQLRKLQSLRYGLHKM